MPTECFNNGKFTEEQNFRYDIENGEREITITLF